VAPSIALSTFSSSSSSYVKIPNLLFGAKKSITRVIPYDNKLVIDQHNCPVFTKENDARPCENFKHDGKYGIHSPGPMTATVPFVIVHIPRSSYNYQ
jgi:hypothetical protein